MARPRKPTSLKMITGTNRPDRNLPEIKVDSGVPDCPKWLNAKGKKYWADVAPILEKNNLLSVCDLSIFSIHCDSMGLYIDACERIDGIDDLIDTTPQDYKVQSVITQLRNKLWDQVMKSGTAFGHSPQARSSIKAEPKKEKKANPFDGI